MKLYYLPGACSLASHIVLEWIGQPYETVKLSHAELQQPDYLKINPAGAVPAIQDADGWTLTQSPAILTYLADTHPQTQLGAADSARARAEFNQWLAHLGSDVHKAFLPIFAPQAFGVDESGNDELRAAAVQKVRALMAKLDARLAGKDHPIGTRNSALDAYLFVFVRWADKLAGGLDAFTNLTRFAARMNADPAVQKVLKDEGL